MICFSKIRPDAVIRTGVIQPWNLAKQDPVAAARQVALAFQNSVGGRRPGIAPYAPSKALSGIYVVNPWDMSCPTSTGVSPHAKAGPQTQNTGPMDNLQPGVVVETVGQSPVFSYYAPARAYQQALSTGSSWDMISARRDLVAAYGVNIPGRF